MKAEDVLIEIISNKQGVKGVELIAEYYEHIRHHGFYDDPSFNPVNTLQKLVEEKKVIEVNYILPNMDYREKSIYFPKNTQITVSPL